MKSSNSIAEIVAQRRNELGYTMVELSSSSGIDQALLSKYESGKRQPSKKHVGVLEMALDLDPGALKSLFIAEKIAEMLSYEVDYREILSIAESRVEYLSSQRAYDLPKLGPEIIERLEEIDKLQLIWSKRKPLDGTQLQKMNEYFKIQYTYDSNKIEGNTLTYQETSLVVNEGLTIGGKSVKDHLEAVNHADAIDFLKSMVLGKEQFTARTLSEIHYLILKSIDQQNAGKYRSVPVRISGSEHVPPQPFQIDSLMEGYFQNYSEQKTRIHPVILAAELHERLVSIHPFIDGNGRTSRLIMNFVLLSNGYTVTSLKGDPDSRIRYYQALEKVQVHNDPEDFYHLIIDRLGASLKEHIDLC
jgi:Fic family protein